MPRAIIIYHSPVTHRPSFAPSSPLYLCAVPPNVTIEKSLVHSSENFDAQLVCNVLAEPQASVSSTGMEWDRMG